MKIINRQRTLNGFTTLLYISFAIVNLGAAAQERGTPSSPQDQETNASVQAPEEEEVTQTTGFTDFDPIAKPYAYVASAAIWQWPRGEAKIIFVCWENPEDRYSTEQAVVQQAIEQTWQAQSQLQFQGWQTCASNNLGIRIKISDEGPHVKVLGRQLDGVPNGMVLNFDFNRWSPVCKESDAQRQYCIRTIAVHEFGHAIGYAHEQNRFDAPGECQDLSQGANGDLLLTPYDPESVMNYCNERYNNDGQLSERDISALVAVYGVPK